MSIHLRNLILNNPNFSKLFKLNVSRQIDIESKRLNKNPTYKQIDDEKINKIQLQYDENDMCQTINDEKLVNNISDIKRDLFIMNEIYKFTKTHPANYCIPLYLGNGAMYITFMQLFIHAEIGSPTFQCGFPLAVFICNNFLIDNLLKEEKLDYLQFYELKKRYIETTRIQDFKL